MSRVRPVFLLVSLLIVGGLTPAPRPVAASTSADLAQQREDFRTARYALRRGNIHGYRRLLRELDDYVLKGYLEYWYLRKRLYKTSDSKIRDFLRRNADSPISTRLRARWLYTLARRDRWDTFTQEYRRGLGTKLRCYHGQALFATGQTKEAMDLADELWLVGRSQPKQCDPVFEQWAAKGGRTQEMVWRRIYLSMDNNRVSLAKYLARFLDDDQQRWAKRWRHMHYRPAEALDEKVYYQNTPLARRILRHGIKRLARRDAGVAYERWQQLRSRHITRGEKDAVLEVDRYIALKGVYQQHPEASKWLAELEQTDEYVRGWRIRAALAQHDWWAALSWIEALPPEERSDINWQYWRARILEMQSHNLPVLRTAAERIYASLANDRSFQGFLAADRLGLPYPLESNRLEYDEDELEAIKQRPGIQRAYELYNLHILGDARREWNYATRDMSDEELQHASVLASRWGWHDRAILTVAKTDHFGDLELRFPIAYRDQVMNQAGEQGVDPAWVYGVIRQESIYMVDARSHAGALGLMQVMPRTGRLTARLLKSRLRSSRELLDADKNIRIGVAYLKRMLDRNDGHPVLATASYNAGPYRVKDWLPQDEPVDADLWIETMPFTETRRYVRRVMAYTVIFDHRLDGEAERMRLRMPVVQPDHQG